MTESDEAIGFRRKSLVWAAGLILVVVIPLSLWYGSGIIQSKLKGDAIREELPPLPDTSDWPEAFTLALQEASEAVSSRRGSDEGLGELAMLYHANAFLKEAEACYTLLNERDPEEARWAYYLADVRLNWGDLASAESLLKRVAALKPSYLPAQIRLGDVLFKSGKSEAAREVYLRSLQLDANNPYALLGLAREHLRGGAEEEALTLLSRLGENNEEFAPGFMLMAQLLEKRGEKERAEVARALGRKHGRYREHPDPWMDTVTTRCYDLDRLTVLADMNVAIRQFERALDILDRAVNISPEFPDVHLIRGMAYSGMGEKDKAIKAYKRALLLGGDTIVIYSALVNLHKKSEEYGEAIAMARKGLEENPDSPELLAVLGELLIEQGNRAEARVHLRKALQEDPSHRLALRNLARTLWEEGRESEAMKIFQELRRLSPLDFHSRAFLAQHYLEREDPEKAEAPLREAKLLEPDSAELRELLLTFLLQSGNRKAREGDYPGAVAGYREALAVDPSNIEIHLNLGQVYAESNAYEAATESLKIYTAERPEDVNGWIVFGDVAWKARGHTMAQEYWQKALIVARGMRNSDRIIAAVEERLRQDIPGR